MKNNFKKTIRKAKEVSLGASEKQLLRSKLLSYMDTVPMSPEIKYRIPSEVSIFSFFKSAYATSALMPALLLFVLLGGGAITLTSAGSLPGDTMYPVKKLSEKMDLLFAFTPAAGARVNAIQAVRRLEEAEALSSRGRLDEVTKVSLESSFTESSGAALRKMDEIQNEDKAVGLRVLTEFRGNLSAHRDILQSIVASADGSVSDTLPKEVQSVLAILSSPTSSVIALGTETSDSAGEAKAEAKGAISGVEKYVGANMSGDAKARAKALGALISAQAAFENGRQAMEDDSYNNAVILFRQATDKALQAKAQAESYNSARRLISKTTDKPRDTLKVSNIINTLSSTFATSTASTTNATSTNATSTVATTTAATSTP